MSASHLPLVSLVGAGPGHPGLLTLRAVECLAQADLVIYDKLVPPTLLTHVRPDAKVVCVTELAPAHPTENIPVLDIIIREARAGKRVVRLKGGDPSIFGRGGEEAEALHAAGVAFEIVPGITAALGAAAYAGIPLTHRAHASGVAIITGHENPDKAESAIDWSALAHFPGTLVIYMGMSRLDRIVAQLLSFGKAPTTPAAVVQWATHGDQITVESTLSGLPDAVRSSGLTAPALIILGEVVALREKVRWFEKLPLHGKRILITRPRHQAEDLVQRVVAHGGVPLLLPTVEIKEPDDWAAVDAAIGNLTQYQWLVFTSSNGVRYFFDRLRLLGRDLRAVGHLKLAAIGPKTADALRRMHLDPDVVPERYQSEDLAAALLERLAAGDRVLLARADRGRDLLRQTLAERCEVDVIAVYSQTDAKLEEAVLLKHLRRGELDYITLTSVNIARVLLQALDQTTRLRIIAGELGLVSISPVTSEEIRRQGLPIAAEAKEATMAGVVEALVSLATGR